MTKKEALAARLNELKIAAGEAPMSEKWYKRAKTWAIESLIEIYEKEAARQCASLFFTVDTWLHKCDKRVINKEMTT